MFVCTMILICTSAVMAVEKKQIKVGAPDYGFVVYLFSKKNSSVGCMGAIVSSSWVLNYCEHDADYKYDTIRVGVKENVGEANLINYVYNIVQRIVHPGHYMQSYLQTSPEFGLQYLYTSRHSLFLDKTDREIKYIAGVVRPINLSRVKTLPPRANVISFSKDGVYNNALNMLNLSVCDDYYQKYNLNIFDDSQYCIDSSSVLLNECRVGQGSHSMMEHKNCLIGIMAWSTGCFSTPEPWVFTNIGVYYSWITEIIAGQTECGHQKQ